MITRILFLAPALVLALCLAGCGAENAPTTANESRPCLRGHDLIGVSLFSPVFVCDEYAPIESTTRPSDLPPRGSCLPHDHE